MVLCLGQQFVTQTDKESYAASVTFRRSMSVNFHSSTMNQYMIFRLCEQQLEGITGKADRVKAEADLQAKQISEKQLACVGFNMMDLNLSVTQGTLTLPLAVVNRPAGTPVPGPNEPKPTLHLRYLISRSRRT